jgi:8-amino-7-oxononanoate synthase
MSNKFKSIAEPFSNTIDVNGTEYLYFGGTAYLGIPQNQVFIDLYINGIKKFGLNNGTSRNNNIQLGIYDEAEKFAAQRFGAEDALITSSGYLAAQLTVKVLSKFGEVLYAPASHPALWLEDQQPDFRSFKDWEIETVEYINLSPQKNWVLISNSMNNLLPEIYDFGFLKEVNSDKNIVLIVDDSHGIGVNNQGLSAYTILPKLSNVECVVVASMAKALGVDAGLILSSAKLIKQLKNTNEFAGASPPAAAGLFAFINAEEVYQQAWNKLQKNIELLSVALNSNWKFEKGFSAFYIDNKNLGDQLLEHKILVSSFPYPDKDSAPINRIVLSSWHTEENILKLSSLIR